MLHGLWENFIYDKIYHWLYIKFKLTAIICLEYTWADIQGVSFVKSFSQYFYNLVFSLLNIKVIIITLY